MSLLGWAFTFLIVAAVAALFGFTGIAAGAMGIARILFGLFLLIFVVLLILALVGCAAPAGSMVMNLDTVSIGSHGAYV